MSHIAFNVTVEHITELLLATYFYIHIFQIAPTSTSPRLSNSEIFPRFLRAISSEAETIFGIVQAMKQFGWSRIAAITQTENLFTFVRFL